MDLITIIPLITGFGFLYWAEQLDEDLWYLKMSFHLLFIPLAWLSVDLSLSVVRVLYGGDSQWIERMGLYVNILGWIFFIIGAAYILRLLLSIKTYLQHKKIEREDERYG